MTSSGDPAPTQLEASPVTATHRPLSPQAGHGRLWRASRCSPTCRHMPPRRPQRDQQAQHGTRTTCCRRRPPRGTLPAGSASGRPLQGWGCSCSSSSRAACGQSPQTVWRQGACQQLMARSTTALHSRQGHAACCCHRTRQGCQSACSFRLPSPEAGTPATVPASGEHRQPFLTPNTSMSLLTAHIDAQSPVRLSLLPALHALLAACSARWQSGSCLWIWIPLASG